MQSGLQGFRETKEIRVYRVIKVVREFKVLRVILVQLGFKVLRVGKDR